VPDVLRDTAATLHRAKKFFINLRDSTYNKHGFTFMGVVQGTSWEELMTCIKSYEAMDEITVLGIPRHLIQTMEQKFVRLMLAQNIEANYGRRFQIHLLGTAPTFVRECRTVYADAPFIRSIDTSLPFNYTIAGEVLQVGSPPVGRPPNYFERIQSMDSVRLARNASTFLRWARGE